MVPTPSRRLLFASAALLLVSAAAAGVAIILAPRLKVNASATLDVVGGRGTRGQTGSDAAIVRVIEYEWPQRFRENEPAVVAVRFRDPSCSAPEKATDRRASTQAVDLADAEVTARLLAHGFRVDVREKRVVLRRCEQSVAWDVVPERAAAHVLTFRFETALGNATVAPSRFDVPVTGALFLPSSVLHRGATALSALSGIVGLGGLVATLRQWAAKLRARARGQ